MLVKIALLKYNKFESNLSPVTAWEDEISISFLPKWVGYGLPREQKEIIDTPCWLLGKIACLKTMSLRATSKETRLGGNLCRKRRKPANYWASVTENGNVPYLNWNDEQAKLNDNSDDNANPNYGSVSRGSVWQNPG